MGCEKHCTVQQYSRVRICSSLFSTFIVLLLLKNALTNYSECRESSTEALFADRQLRGQIYDCYVDYTIIILTGTQQ